MLLLVALAIAPLFLFTVYQGVEERRRAAARERAEARRLVLLFGAEHDRVVADARQILFVLAQAPAVRRANAAECAALFRDVLAASPQYENLLLADLEWVVRAAAHPAELDDEDRTVLARAAASTFAVGPIRLLGGGGPDHELRARRARERACSEDGAAGQAGDALGGRGIRHRRPGPADPGHVVGRFRTNPPPAP
jgi:hypothetical protein